VQVKISARHGHLGDAAQAMIRDKAQKLLHYFDRLTIIEVTADLHEDQKTVEVLVSAEHKHDFVARESNGELQVALDLALDKVVHQLRRYKEKIQDHRRTPPANGAAGRPASGSPAARPEPERS
jgi:putative sigma-54 modulation protein